MLASIEFTDQFGNRRVIHVNGGVATQRLANEKPYAARRIEPMTELWRELMAFSNYLMEKAS